ncbi:MAG TPA: amidohydrolase family protein [Gemmatimonadales bacterium]|nr:amidohydrolase family protein [Gemmatimonadales bacterium]
MRLTPAVRALTLAAALLPPTASSLLAQSDTWALTNARIQTVTKGVIDKGTILIRKGLIEAVGPAVTVPADARVIDLAGKTVSPGLIDLTSSLGLAAPPAGGGGQGGGGGGAAPPAPSGPRGLEPERDVARELKVAPADVKPIRDAGIAAVLVAPSRGLFRGMSALIPLRDSVDDSEVIRAQVAMHIGYQGVPGDYPGTLLGVIAYQRQAFFDAQRQGLLQDRYRTNPRGIGRPDNDPGLDALVPVVRGQKPAFIDANNENEIRRAVRLAREFNLKAAIVGATEGFEAVDALAGRPTVVSVNFPQPAQTTGWSYRLSQRRAPNDSAAAARDAQKLIEGNAGALNKAGIKIALASGGTRPSDFLGNVRKAVAAGLPAGVALEALTIRPAELAGAGEMLGSIEAGKIANLVVSNGDLLADSSRISLMFVDGIRYEVAPPPARTAGGNTAGPAAQLGGAWTMTLQSPQGPLELTMTVTQSGSTFSGSMVSPLGASEVSGGEIAGRTATWSTTIQVGGQSITLNYRGEVDGNRMTGSADLGTFGTATFTAEKKP